MRNRTIIIRLFFLFCFAVFPSAYAQDMSFNYLTTDNGLSQFTVYALYNDEWGQIWIGTRDGLNVYNGNRIKTYKEEKGNPTTLLGRTVRRICGNGKGLIYVLTTEGVSELDMKTETFTHISDKQKEWMTAITYCDCLWVRMAGSMKGRKQPEYKRPIVTFRDRYCLIVC